jgi:uncharacterized membrane protein YeaQ/YmgE (transglycosylase-associated protein family)
MHLSNRGLLVILVVGVISGWLAGKIVKGHGLGLVGDAAVGIVGALIGDWVLHRLGLHFGAGIHRSRRQRHNRSDRVAPGFAASSC